MMATTPLAGRRILLIGMGFYDYEVAIAAEFRRQGAEVRLEDERPPAARRKLAAVRRRMPLRNDAGLARHRTAMLRRAAADAPLDYVVVIKGELIDGNFVAALRRLQPRAMLISYQWDSMRRFPGLIERQALFDRVLTFDQADAARYPGFRLRPTFFRPEIVTVAPIEPALDLCFVGWLHHDRVKQVEALRAQARDLGLSSFFYLFTGLRTGLHVWFGGRGRDVHVRALPFAQYARYIAASRIIVDLPHPDQTGLTMRACEAVGTGKKLLTTAADVAAYDFYRPENVSVIDAAAPRIDPAFVASTPLGLPPELVARYSLSGWALDVLGVTEPRGFLRNISPGKIDL